MTDVPSQNAERHFVRQIPFGAQHRDKHNLTKGRI